MRLLGKPAVMHYLGINSQPTWTRYKRLGLPLLWTPGGHVVANSQEVDKWLRQVGKPRRNDFPLPRGG
jgi:predicted DNA-binding transcriptional regulator AlpA